MGHSCLSIRMNCRTLTMLSKQQWSGWRNKTVFQISDFLSCCQCSACWKGKGNYVECSVRSEWDLQLCYLNAKDVGGRLAWIQRERRRMLSPSCHCNLFKNVLTKGMGKLCTVKTPRVITVSGICYTCNKCADKDTVEDLLPYFVAVWM